mgnify:FL=1
MQPTSSLGQNLNHLAFVLGRQSDQILQERLGIGISQFKIMTALQEKPNIQQKQIAGTLGQTEASISRQIKLMLDQGLLQTNINPANRREHITVLTLKGERLTDEARNILNSYHSPVFESLSPKQQENLAETLDILHSATCRADRPGSCSYDKL